MTSLNWEEETTLANKQVREDQDIDLRLLPRNVTFNKDGEPVRRQR